jgi:hypothetical protein
VSAESCCCTRARHPLGRPCYDAVDTLLPRNNNTPLKMHIKRLAPVTVTWRALFGHYWTCRCCRLNGRFRLVRLCRWRRRRVRRGRYTKRHKNAQRLWLWRSLTLHLSACLPPVYQCMYTTAFPHYEYGAYIGLVFGDLAPIKPGS